MTARRIDNQPIILVLIARQVRLIPFFTLFFFPAFQGEFHTPWPDSPPASNVKILFRFSGDEGVFQPAAIQPINMCIKKH